MLTFVSRRVGGFESAQRPEEDEEVVSHRVGGFKTHTEFALAQNYVNRRVGGFERLGTRRCSRGVVSRFRLALPA